MRNSSQETLTQWTKRQFKNDKFKVFNWLTGETCELSELISDLHNRYTVHGLLADDLSRMGCTAGDIDSWPISISELETEGKNFLTHFGTWMFSPVTGNYCSPQDAILSIMEYVCTGTGIISHTAQQVESLSMQDLQNRRVN